MRRSTKQKLLATGVIVTLWVLVSSLFSFFGLFSQPHNRFSDLLHDASIRGDADVVVVAIDKKSLKTKEEGGLGRWQDWERAYYAQAIENLRQAGARVIGIDVFFSEPTTDRRLAVIQEYLSATKGQADQATLAPLAGADDRALHDALATQKDVILAADVAANGDILLPTPTVAGTGSLLGSVALIEDADNIMRRAPLWTRNSIVPYSFPFALFLAWTGAQEGDFSREGAQVVYKGPPLRDAASGRRLPLWSFPVDAAGEILIRFQGTPHQRFPLVSFVDAYNNSFEPATVKDKTVLIGEVDAGLHDDFYSPASDGQKRPGVEIHAHALQSLINNDTVGEAPLWLHALATFLVTLVLVLVGVFGGPLWALGALIVLLIATFMGSYAAFGAARLIFSFWYMGLALVGAYACVLLYKIFLEQREKKQAIKAFSYYVSDKVASMIVRDPSLLRLGGQKKVLTVSFTDIAGFTSLSEQLTPEQISDFLHIYLDTMTQVILKEDGTLDKYIGDAIMAIYGAPLEYPDHAIRACRAALAMHAAIPDVIRQLPLALPEDLPLAIRTGIATGEMVVGNFGSHKRFDYTVIGDTVNLSSRLEGANKAYASQICVSEDTYTAAKEVFLFRTLDVIKVKGKNKPVRIYELLAARENIDRNLEAMAESFERGFLQYQQKDFDAARETFRDLHQTYADKVSEIYMHRCAAYKETPPPANWDGSFTMTTK